jgi:hypothetical protein
MEGKVNPLFSSRRKWSLIAVAGLVLAFFGSYITVQTVQASIDYWLQEPLSFFTGLNSITAYCKNGGGMDGDFYLVLTFKNASFSTETKQSYLKVDNSTVKLPFLLHKGEQTNKLIYFSIDENVEYFTVTVTLEKKNIQDNIFIKPNPMYPTQLSYVWNKDSSQFVAKIP